MKKDVLKPFSVEDLQLPPSLLREKKRREDQYEADTDKSEVEEPVQKKLRRNSSTQTRPVTNERETDVSERIADTGNKSRVISTKYGKSDAFDDDDIDLSSLSVSDKDYYQNRLRFCLCKTVHKKFRKQK